MPEAIRPPQWLMFKGRSVRSRQSYSGSARGRKSSGLTPSSHRLTFGGPGCGTSPVRMQRVALSAKPRASGGYHGMVRHTSARCTQMTARMPDAPASSSTTRVIVA